MSSAIALFVAGCVAPGNLGSPGAGMCRTAVEISGTLGAWSPAAFVGALATGAACSAHGYPRQSARPSA
jgi:hypothetical protein